jgi:hypothetical protein
MTVIVFLSVAIGLDHLVTLVLNPIETLAQCNRDLPSLPAAALMSAPLSMSNSATEGLRHVHAMCKGVYPVVSVMFTTAPLSRSNFATDRRSLPLASCSGVMPCLSVEAARFNDHYKHLYI